MELKLNSLWYYNPWLTHTTGDGKIVPQMTIKPHNDMCPQVQVFQEADEVSRDTIGAKNLP
jgi:hypothetical protein